MPEPLHWFKWEAYTTWLSGFALMVVLYYFDAGLRLVDRDAADLDEWQAIALSVAGIALAWIVYDLLCRTVGQRSQVALAVIGTGLVALAAWGAGELFSPRAAYLQVGVMLGTIMAANVFFTIIPAHRELIRAKQEGREPDATPGLRGKQRSVHNNYLTLPVVFTMLAGHFPLAFGSDHAWLVLLAIFVLVAAIRHFFNLWHTGRRAWWILAAAGAGAVALVFALAPEEVDTSQAPNDELAKAIVIDRCASCHSGINAPLGVRLTSIPQMEEYAGRIVGLVKSGVMPPGNSTAMTEAERAQLVAWAAARG
jgi:uncharacterized membrane protein